MRVNRGIFLFVAQLWDISWSTSILKLLVLCVIFWSFWRPVVNYILINILIGWNNFWHIFKSSFWFNVLYKWHVFVPGGYSGLEIRSLYCSIFDISHIAYITLNGVKYLHDDVVSDFARNDYVGLYTMFNNFKKYFYWYDKLLGGSQVNFLAFKSMFPILVFDLMKQIKIMNV